jgi:cyclopropane fatty-acyl-phospholipid synthase-like methyltransferase
MTTCPLCHSDHLTPIIERPAVPVFQNALLPTAERARAAPAGRLAIQRCGACGFVFNAGFDPDLITYSQDYENDQSLSPVFSAHLDAMAARVLADLPARASVLEVGCGQGGFVRRLADAAPGRLNTVIGFDPAYRGDPAPAPGVRFEARYFDRAAADAVPGGVSAVVSRHTIEHVADPVAFLSAIRDSLGPRSKARLFVETPTVEWIFQHRVVQDMFYEHCNYFTADTLAAAMRHAGFAVDRVLTVFDGQYLWAEGTAAGVDRTPIAADDGLRAAAYAHAVATSIDAWRQRLIGAGPVVLWGAGAKGVTFASTIDPDGRLIAGLVDMNPGKQGRFVPLSAHPVLAPSDLPALAPTTIIVMNPNYRAEIVAEIAALGLTSTVLDG